MLEGLLVRVIAALALGGSVFLACSAPAAPAPLRSGGTSGSDSSDDDDAAPAASASTPSTTPPATSACGTKSTAGDCTTCCGETASTFAATNTKFDDCACAGPCKTLCTAYCGNRSSDAADACLNCLEATATETACGSQADAVCAADPACKAVSACEDAAHCAAKPNANAPDGG